jgi:hypothetical protein
MLSTEERIDQAMGRAEIRGRRKLAKPPFE